MRGSYNGSEKKVGKKPKHTKHVLFFLTSHPHIVYIFFKEKKKEKENNQIFFSDETKTYFFLYVRDAKYAFFLCNCLLINYISSCYSQASMTE